MIIYEVFAYDEIDGRLCSEYFSNRIVADHFKNKCEDKQKSIPPDEFAFEESSEHLRKFDEWVKDHPFEKTAYVFNEHTLFSLLEIEVIE